MTDNGKEAGTSLPTVFDFGAKKIAMKLQDGSVMVNATEMGKAFGKKPANWLRTPAAQEYIKAVADDRFSYMRSGTNEPLVHVKNGGEHFGTWMDEDVALEFARWLSPQFAIWTNRHIKMLLQKRLYGQVATTGSLRKKCATLDFNGTMIYNYRDVQRALGYSTSSSTANVRRVYASSVYTLNGKCYVTEMYVNLMVHRATVRDMAKTVQLALPLVSADFGKLPLF